MAASSSSLCNILSPILPSSRSQISQASPPNHLSPRISSKFPPLICSWPSPSSSPARILTKRDVYVPLCLGSDEDAVFSCSSDLLPVVSPSLAYANILLFKSAYNVQVVVDENEPEERLMNRFRREVMKAGIIQETKRRRFYENKQEEKKRKTREAAKRNSRRRFRRKPMPLKDNKRETPKVKKDDDEDDNWDLPEGDLPF